MKRIALLINDLAFGGAQRIFAELSVALANEGYDVHLFLMNDRDIAYAYGGTVHKISFYYKQNSPLMSILTLQHLILIRHFKKKLKIDISVSAMDFLNLYNLLSPCGDRIIPSIHNYFLQYEMTPTLKDKLIERFFSKKVKKADSVVTVAKAIKKKAEGLYIDVPKEKIVSIYNASDIDLIKQKSKEDVSSDVLPFLGQKTFVNVVRLTEQKALHNLIVAFSQLNKKYPDTKLILIGDGHLKEKLTELAQSLGVSESILFTGFTVNPFAIVSKCRSFVFSSYFEGFGNVLVEAMCCGVSVISADCLCGPAEIINPSSNEPVTDVLMGEYGILTPANDGKWSEKPNHSTKCLTRAMESVLKDDNLHRHYCEKSLERSDDFSGEKIYPQWFKLIEGGGLS